MLEKRWWYSVAVIVFFRASLLLKWRTRMPRLCRYECSDVMISKMACQMSTHTQISENVKNVCQLSIARSMYLQTTQRISNVQQCGSTSFIVWCRRKIHLYQFCNSFIAWNLFHCTRSVYIAGTPIDSHTLSNVHIPYELAGQAYIRQRGTKCVSQTCFKDPLTPRNWVRLPSSKPGGGSPSHRSWIAFQDFCL